MTKQNKRISHKDFFEYCYLRHQYLRRVKHNPTREEMAPYNKIVENFARNTFYIYKNLFLLVGLDLEDIVNISQIHLVSYLGLFALEQNPNKLADFKRTFRNYNSIVCSPSDVLDKNKANFTCFLKQRLEDVVRVCRQKAKNIKGLSVEEFLVFRGIKKPPKDIEDLLENYSKHGYSPLNTSVFKTIKKRMKTKQEGPVYLEKGIWYVCVPIRKKCLSITDFTCNDYNPYDNLHNMNPEEILEIKQEDNWNSKWLKFNSISKNDRVKIIESFVSENKNNPKFREEVRIAHKFLESVDDNPNL